MAERNLLAELYGYDTLPAEAGPRPRPRGFRLQSADQINRDYGPPVAGRDFEVPTPEENQNALAQLALMAAGGPLLGGAAKFAGMFPRATGVAIGGLSADALNSNEATAQKARTPNDADTRLPNGYSRRELDDIAASTGISSAELAAMRRAQVQAVASRAAEIKQAEAQRGSSARADAEAERIKRQTFEDSRKAEASLPYRERYPEFAANLPYYGLAAAAGLPALGAAVGKSSSFMPFSTASRVGRDIRAGESALASGEAGAMGLAGNRLAERMATKPSFAGKTFGDLAKAGLAAGSGGALAAESQLFPDQFDAFNPNLPEGPAKDSARQRALSVEPYLERAAIGTLTGLSGYKVGSMLAPGRSPDWARAQGTRQAIDDAAAAGGGRFGGQGANGGNGPQVPPPGRLSNTTGRYPPPGSPEREYIRDEYRSAVNDFGAPLPPRAAGRVIQERASSEGGSLPDVSGRIKETNAGYADFVNKNGRPPVSKSDWDQVYRKTGTLAIPAAAGAAAASSPDQAQAQPDDFARELAAIRALMDGLGSPQQFPPNAFASARNR